MKRLACFLLEGLVEQGPHRVWITLGTFDSIDAAQLANQSDYNPIVIETRVMALYRDSGITAASTHRAHISGGTSAVAENPTGFTVA